jgi:hypothetical protein
MTRKPYPTDVSDEEWHFAAPYLALMTEAAPQRQHSLREVFNALRWIARAGALWRMLPNDFPPWEAVYQQTGGGQNRGRPATNPRGGASREPSTSFPWCSHKSSNSEGDGSISLEMETPPTVVTALREREFSGFRRGHPVRSRPPQRCRMLSPGRMAIFMAGSTL